MAEPTGRARATGVPRSSVLLRPLLVRELNAGGTRATRVPRLPPALPHREVPVLPMSLVPLELELENPDEPPLSRLRVVGEARESR
jgi:hypothetical protein